MMRLPKYFLSTLLLTSLLLPALLSNPVSAQGICDRTQPIQSLLLEKLRMDDCSTVTAEDLESITESKNQTSRLIWLGKNIETIGPNDLKGMPYVTRIWASFNKLTTMPAGVFDSLNSTIELTFTYNNITSIEDNAFGGLTNLENLYLGHNPLANLQPGAFANLTATTIDLRNSLLTSLPLNLFANHTAPSNIEHFVIMGNPLTDNTWEITNVSWVQNSNNLESFTLQIGHALPEDVTINISSNNGNLNTSSIVITKGNTVSDSVAWTNISVAAQAQIIPTLEQINVTILAGHINIPQLSITGICTRSADIQQLILDNIAGIDNCEDVTLAHLQSINNLPLKNAGLTSLIDIDLDFLTAINEFNLSDNNLATLMNGLLDQTAPNFVNFANNSIAAIGKLALFTNNQGENSISINLSNNSITTATLASGFLTANGAQKFVGGEFDLSSNQISAVAASSFAGFNPSALLLNDNVITSITDDAFADATDLLELNLANNLLTTVTANAFASLTNLKSLELDNNQITTIETDAFASLTNLRTLWLRDNQLTAIPADAFASLNLILLNLQGNQLSSIPADGFKNLTALFIDLSNNSISNIPTDAFASLNRLNILNLGSNNISNIAADGFKNLTATFIDLSNNNLATLPLNLLATHRNPSNISTFDLSGNTLINDTWEITNASWVQDITNPGNSGNFTLQIGHALPQDITIDILSHNGAINTTSITIPRGSTVSDTVAWTGISLLATPNIIPAQTQINIAILGGHINIDVFADTPSFTAAVDTITVTSGRELDSITLPIATGGNGILSYSLFETNSSDASLPGSLVFTSATRTLSGSIDTAGNYNLTYTVSDIDGDSINLSFIVEILPDLKPSFPSNDNITYLVVVNETVNITLPEASAGNAAITYALTNTEDLPTGLIFNATSRKITGSTTEIGDYKFVFTATDSFDNDMDTLNITIRVEQQKIPGFNESETFVSKSMRQDASNFKLELPSVTGGNGNLTYTFQTTVKTVLPAALPSKATTESLASAQSLKTTSRTTEGLPAGLFFNATSRAIEGKPTVFGQFVITAMVEDDDLTQIDDSDSFSFELELIQSLGFATDLQANYTVTSGVAFSQVLPVGTGGVLNSDSDTYDYAITGTLPTGLSFDANTRTISGTTTEVGNFTVTYTITDSDSINHAQDIMLIVELPAPVFVSQVNDITALIGENINMTLPPVTTHNMTTITYSISGLPNGVDFNATSRELTGSTTQTGKFTVLYEAKDPLDQNVSLSFVITVALPAPKFLSPVDNMTVEIGENINMTLPEVNTHSMTTITYSVSGLPNGVDFNATSRALTGSTTQTGKFTAQYTAKDPANLQVNQSFVITVNTNTVLIQDILWRQALAIADQTVNSVKKRFDLVNQHRLPYTQTENYQGANFQVTQSNWLGLWTNIGSSSLENSENGFSWDGDTDNIQFGVDFSGENYLVGVMSETVSTSASFAVAADKDYTGNLDLDDLSLFSIYGGYYQDKYSVWAITSSGSGTAELSITGNNGTLSSGVDYAMTAVGGSYKITDLLDIGFEGITSASLDLANNAISSITSNSASRNKVFGSIDFGRWTKQPNAQSDFSWKPAVEFALRSDSGDGASSTSGLELTAAVELEYKIINFEFGLRTFSADNYSETGQWFTFHLIPGAETGLNLELTQRLGDTESVSDSIFNNAELTDVVAGLSQSNALNSIGKISYGWARDTGTYRLFTQGQSQVNHAQTATLFGDVSAMFGSEAGIVWDSIGIAFDSADSKFSWTSDIQGGMVNKYFNNMQDNTEETTVSFAAEIKF